MNYPSYYGAFSGITNYILSSATAHILVSSTGMGEDDDFSVSGEDAYPRVFLELPIISNWKDNTIDWDFVLTVTDIELQDRTNEQEKLSLTWDIGNDLFEKFKSDARTGNTYFFKSEEYNSMSLTQFGNDYTAGHRFEFQISQRIPMNKCLIYDRFSGTTS